MSCPFSSIALSILLASQHHVAGDFNERHQGIGVEYPANCNVAVIAGTFQNSLNNRTIYTGVQYEENLVGLVYVGAVGAIGTGYEFPVGGALTLRAGPVRVLHVPAAVTAVQFRLEF